jgi:hypothetical protein
MLCMHMCYEDVSGLNWLRIAYSGDHVSVKLLCSVTQPLVQRGAESHVWTVI